MLCQVHHFLIPKHCLQNCSDKPIEIRVNFPLRTSNASSISHNHLGISQLNCFSKPQSTKCHCSLKTLRKCWNNWESAGTTSCLLTQEVMSSVSAASHHYMIKTYLLLLYRKGVLRCIFGRVRWLKHINHRVLPQNMVKILLSVMMFSTCWHKHCQVNPLCTIHQDALKCVGHLVWCKYGINILFDCSQFKIECASRKLITLYMSYDDQKCKYYTNC